MKLFLKFIERLKKGQKRKLAEDQSRKTVSADGKVLKWLGFFIGKMEQPARDRVQLILDKITRLNSRLMEMPFQTYAQKVQKVNFAKMSPVEVQVLNMQLEAYLFGNNETQCVFYLIIWFEEIQREIENLLKTDPASMSGDVKLILDHLRREIIRLASEAVWILPEDAETSPGILSFAIFAAEEIKDDGALLSFSNWFIQNYPAYDRLSLIKEKRREVLNRLYIKVPKKTLPRVLVDINCKPTDKLAAHINRTVMDIERWNVCGIRCSCGNTRINLKGEDGTDEGLLNSPVVISCGQCGKESVLFDIYEQGYDGELGYYGDQDKESNDLIDLECPECGNQVFESAVALEYAIHKEDPVMEDSKKPLQDLYTRLFMAVKCTECGEVSDSVDIACASGLTGEQRYALAMDAIVTEANEESHSLLYGEEDKNKARLNGAYILKEWWNVESREELLETIDWLYLEGHRQEYARQKGNNEDINKSKILAFDLCRLISVARWGAAAGYINDDEAWRWLLTCAKDLQKYFHSWEELAESYLLGRSFWAGSKNNKFKEVVESLLDEDNYDSPWNHIKWGYY